jgi:SAM-dependent methyltransferase
MLAQAVMAHFPHCHYIALDGSEAMRQYMSQELARYADRLEIRPFDLADTCWRDMLPAVRCILSSLAIHHLPGEEKHQLFKDMAAHLEPGGALLLADILLPATRHIADLYARQYDEIVRQQSLERYGDLSGYEEFCAHRWNYFTYDYSDPASTDVPSLLSEQLEWLREASLAPVDCFWLRAGHAVFGGYKQ